MGFRGALGGLAAPVAGMIEAPLLHALDMHVVFEVIKVFGFLQPASLTISFADFAALGLGTVALTRHITVVGMEEHSTVQTLTLLDWICHRPESPQPYDLQVAV